MDSLIEAPRALKEKLLAIKYEQLRREERNRLEGSFIEFFKAAWSVMDPAPYTHGWHLEAIAEHLEAVARGHIRKLLINVPPRHSKTLLTSVAWPAWIWAQPQNPDLRLMGPQAKLLCLSYSDQLVLDNAVAARRLIESEWYQTFWGDRVQITKDQDAKNRFDLTAGGTRISASFGGTVTGRGADIRVIDDPHKAEDAQRDAIREKVLQTYNGTLKSRITDPRHSAEVIIMQRVHQADLSGHVLEDDPEFVHLCLPAEYEPGRHCTTVLGWEDPRQHDGELLWPERFGNNELKQYKRNIYEWAGQWQQRPAPKGGGIFKDEWWQTYPVPASGAYEFDRLFVLASLDTAFKEKEENDYSALVVWAVYDDPKTTRRCVILIDGWKKRLPMHGVAVPRLKDEDERAYLRRAAPKWGLVEWVNYTCKKRRVNRLLIEDSARGHDVSAEIQRLFGDRDWGVRLELARGDKWARAHSVVDVFTDEMVHAPGEWLCRKHMKARCKEQSCPPEDNIWRWRDWADEIIRDMSIFPMGDHDDAVDAAVHGIRHLRDIGLLIRRDERLAIEQELAENIPRDLPALYPA